MFVPLLILFVFVPLIELAVLIRIGRAISLGPTLALVVATGILGAALARHEGLKVLARIRADLARGTMPQDEIISGLLILLAGALLITPGVLTDAFGFFLLIPFGRRIIRGVARRYLRTRMVIVGPSVDDGFVDVPASDVSSPGSHRKRID